MMDNSQQRGFAMMEVLVTAIVLSIGISGVGMLLIRAVQSTQDSSQQTQAMWIVQDYIGRIRANPEGARAKDYEITVAIDCDSTPNTMCADHRDGNSETSASSCTASQMANYDRWITVCGIDEDTMDSSSEFIINPQLTASCTLTDTRVSTSSGQPDCVQYDVTLTWGTRLQQSGDSAAERTNQSSYNMVVELN